MTLLRRRRPAPADPASCKCWACWKARDTRNRERDLRDYAVVERQALTGSYRGYDIITAPPPSSGGPGILQMLGVLEGSGYEKSGAGSAAELHYLAETMRRYFADRAASMGDPDFVKVPLAGLLDPAYIAQLRKSIDPEHATPSSQIHG